MKEEGGMDLRTLENLPKREVKGILEVTVKGSEKTRAYLTESSNKVRCPEVKLK